MKIPERLLRAGPALCVIGAGGLLCMLLLTIYSGHKAFMEKVNARDVWTGRALIANPNLTLNQAYEEGLKLELQDKAAKEKR